MTIPERIQSLRNWMKSLSLDAIVIPSGDPHKSEYVAEHWKMRIWIAGFTGSAGTVIITQDHVGLWTDSRYFLQAEEELKESGGVLHKLTLQGGSDHVEWLAKELPEGSTVGIDGYLFSSSEVKSMEKILNEKNISLNVSADPFAEIWNDRPSLPKESIFEISADIVGRDRSHRIADLETALKAKGAKGMLLTALDEIAWLLNLRGRDVECNPVFIAYAVWDGTHMFLFTDPDKINDELKGILQGSDIFIEPYESINTFLQNLPTDLPILVDAGKTSHALCELLKSHNIIWGDSPITMQKAVKNATEQQHIRHVMVKDGIALLRAYRWLEETLTHREVSEAEFASQIAHSRSLMPGYFGESFNAIIGYQSNGAIIHYKPEYETAAMIRPEGMLLVDSGGQYTDGTTDTTRTHHLGTPTAEQKLHYTLVLQGHISLAMAVFPEGTKGIQLDLLARQHLWQRLLNFGHGTGHGVGFFMNVHEPPQGFVASLNERGTTAHEPGMLSSNEPGFYVNGSYGIRIENLVLCQPAGESSFGKFNKFETVTLFPIDTNLIEADLMSPAEKKWLNEYHVKVMQFLGPHLEMQEREWLEKKCQPI